MQAEIGGTLMAAGPEAALRASFKMQDPAREQISSDPFTCNGELAEDEEPGANSLCPEERKRILGERGHEQRVFLLGCRPAPGDTRIIGRFRG